MNEMAKHITSLDTLAGEINSIKGQTRQMIMSASIEIGRRLTDAKVLCSHGQWGNWLKNKVDYSQRTAQNLMRMFEEYGNGQINLFGKAKTQALADLGYTQAVALLSLPAEEREEFIEENDIDEMSTRELQEAIREKKEKETELQNTKIDLEESQVEIERLNKQIKALGENSENSELVDEIERLKAVLEEKTNDLSDSQAEINRLVEEINEKERSSADPAEVNDLKDKLKKEKEKSKKLREELKKPIKPQIKEIIPEAVKAELEAYKKRLVNEDSPLIAKFRVQFEEIQHDFIGIRNTMNEIGKADMETGKKVEKALVTMLEEMMKKLKEQRG